MFHKNNIALIILLSTVLSINCVFAQKIDVTILYESLCRDSIKFIDEQLNPVWSEIAPYININFVPFGKSSSMNGGQDFKCQHGPMECAGNKIQSCALSGIDDTNSQVQFVHCFMNSFSINDVGQSCAAKVGLNWDFVNQCFHSQMGILLQLQAESITKNITPKFVPTIIFNGIFNQEDQNESLVNFKNVVCKHLNNLYPGMCQ